MFSIRRWEINTTEIELEASLLVSAGLKNVNWFDTVN